MMALLIIPVIFSFAIFFIFFHPACSKAIFGTPPTFIKNENGEMKVELAKYKYFDGQEVWVIEIHKGNIVTYLKRFNGSFQETMDFNEAKHYFIKTYAIHDFEMICRLNVRKYTVPVCCD